ncbi:MAG TPA: hypothetical protein VNA87_04125 [Actinomycetota bacterium]|nr:hypothetical protein [Actinomycetota bacterium]
MRIGHPHLEPGAPAIYLDQNRWVGLARALVGRVDGGYPEYLAKASALVASGHVSFPLSDTHYKETWRARDAQWRLHLGLVMGRLSRFRTIAPISVVVGPEIDAAFQQLLGKPASPRRIDVLGEGVRHALGYSGYPVPSQMDPAEEFLMEGFILMSPGEPNTPRDGSVERHQAAQQHAQLQKKRQSKLHSIIRSKAARSRAVASLVAEDAIREIAASGIRAGISTSELEELLNEIGIEYLIYEIPTLYAIAEMRRVAHEDPNRRWKDTDMNDIRALSVATVYCDYIWTEKEWAHLMNRGNAVSRFATSVVSQERAALDQLP